MYTSRPVYATLPTALTIVGVALVSIQGVASLSSGWFLYHWGWRGVLLASFPLVLLFAVLAFSNRSIESARPKTA